jgi:hypothetical protein
MAKLRLLLLSISTLVFINVSVATATQEYIVKAALTLNFARFTEWPAEILKDSDAVINVCVLGDDDVQQAFLDIENKEVGKRVIKLMNLSRTRDLAQCQLIFASNLDKNKSIQLLSEVKNQASLTIGEQNDFLKNGGMVNLGMVDGTIHIEINLSATKQTKIQISSRVLKLATIVDP